MLPVYTVPLAPPLRAGLRSEKTFCSCRLFHSRQTMPAKGFFTCCSKTAKPPAGSIEDRNEIDNLSFAGKAKKEL